MADEVVGKKEYDELMGDNQRLRNLAIYAVDQDRKNLSVYSKNRVSAITAVNEKLTTLQEQKLFRRYCIEELQLRHKAQQAQADKIAVGIMDERRAEREAQTAKAARTSPGFPGKLRG